MLFVFMFLQKRLKRGEEELMKNVIFLVLTIMFFSMLFYFVYSYSTGTGIYEEAYAKKIALLLDSSRPGTQIILDVKELKEIAEKNEKTTGEIVSFDENTGEVKVSLSKQSGYSFYTFSGNKVDLITKEDYLILNIGDKELDDSYLDEIIEDIEKYVFEDVNSEEMVYVMENSGSCFCSVEDGECLRYSSLILQYSGKYKDKKLDPYLVLAVIEQESNCRNIESAGGDIGLMQINSNVHCGYHELPEDKSQCESVLLSDIEKNIQVGIEILEEGYNNFNEKGITKICDGVKETKTYYGWDAALRAYNGAGCGGVIDYVEEVNSRYEKLKELSTKFSENNEVENVV